MRYFFDSCLSPRFAQAMKLLCQGHCEVMHLTDHFPPDTADPVWILALKGEADLCIVSGDCTISRSKKEREVWKESGLTAFFFGSGFGDKGFWVQMAELVRVWPLITEAAKTAVPGSGFLIPFSARALKPIH